MTARMFDLLLSVPYPCNTGHERTQLKKKKKHIRPYILSSLLQQELWISNSPSKSQELHNTTQQVTFNFPQKNK